jgi:hypothetical protein
VKDKIRNSFYSRLSCGAGATLLITLIATFVPISPSLIALQNKESFFTVKTFSHPFTLQSSRQNNPFQLTADAAESFGVQTLSPSDFNNGVDKLTDAGVEWLRIGVPWKQLAPTWPTLPISEDTWSPYDAALTTAKANDYKVIVVLGANPDWAASFERGPIDLDDFDEFKDYVTADVHYWELYNEPDAVSRSPAEAFGDHPQEYTDTLQAAYVIIKSIDPAALVLLGGIAYDDFYEVGQNPNGRFAQDFLDQILALGAALYFDVMNFHYYPEYDENWESLTGLPGIRAKTEAIRSVLTNHGIDKPIICTELGESSGINGDGKTEDTQAQAVVKHFTRAMASKLHIAIWYNMNDYNSTQDPFREHGLLDYPSFDPKPSLDSFATLTTILQNHIFISNLAKPSWLGTNLEGYIFWDKANNKETIIFWSEDGNPQDVTIPDGAIVLDKYGNPCSPPASIGEDPLIIIRDVTFQYIPLIMK